jgi:sialate O-acetylesterase
MIRHPFLSPIFSDHMVLQRDRENTFWGWTTPGAKVKVSIGNHKAETSAHKDGKWTVKVMPPKTGGPYEIDIEGPQKVRLMDVLVGDVWICGGQSNMQFGIDAVVGGKQGLAITNQPNIRFTIIPTRMSFHPDEFTPATWNVCSPDSVGHGEWGSLSAVGFYFGRELQDRLKVPIGLVNDCRGGSSAESWVSRETLDSVETLKSTLARVDEAELSGHAVHAKEVEDWIQATDTGSKENAWTKASLDDHDWSLVNLPNDYHALGFGGFTGVAWFRTVLELPNPVPAGDATLSLGSIDNMDWTWINESQVGATFDKATERRYTIPASQLKPGPNLIAIRVHKDAPSDGFRSPANSLYLQLGDGTRLPLAGPRWRAKLGPHLWVGPHDYPWGLEGMYNSPLVHYNGMIAPIAPLAVKGAIWYQGETNVGRSREYIELMQLVAKDWRKAFETENFPFLQVQLANYGHSAMEPVESSWAALREAQQASADRIPHGGLVSAVDIGDPNDIHPHNKRDVGLRLARLALHKVYGHKEESGTGPRLKSFSIQGSSLHLKFDSGSAKLVAKNRGLVGFELAGQDRKFYWATATLSGQEVILSCPEVPIPVAARYGWADNPTLSLFDSDGLPAFPFRTDDWPVK